MTNAYLSQFDRRDRNDYDPDGNFNEPDGYIDHFLALHAGVGEEGVGGDRRIGLLDRRLHDEPEDGALGIIAHEYGHDLVLLDSTT